MALITALPRVDEGHLLRFPALDVEGSYEYLLFSFWSRYGEATELVFFPENKEPVYVTAAKELLGTELYELLMRSRLFDVSQPGMAGIDVPDWMVDTLVLRLNAHLESTPVCEHCFRVLASEGMRTCAADRDQLGDNVAKNLGQYAETPFGDIATLIREQLWEQGVQPPEHVLIDSAGVFREIMRLQELIGEFLPQTRWRELVDTVEITESERSKILEMTRYTGSVVHFGPNGRMGWARAAYIIMIALVLRTPAQFFL